MMDFKRLVSLTVFKLFVNVHFTLTAVLQQQKFYATYQANGCNANESKVKDEVLCGRDEKTRVLFTTNRVIQSLHWKVRGVVSLRWGGKLHRSR